jgi:hypothetical protein
MKKIENAELNIMEGLMIIILNKYSNHHRPIPEWFHIPEVCIIIIQYWLLFPMPTFNILARIYVVSVRAISHF